MEKSSGTVQQNRQTAKRQRIFSKNLSWELSNARMDERDLVNALKEHKGCENITLETVSGWIQGNAANPFTKYRKALKEIFGYDTQGDIFRDNHIYERQKISEHRPKDAPELNRMLMSLSRSKTRTDTEVVESVQNMLSDPSMAAYTRILIHWLESYS